MSLTEADQQFVAVVEGTRYVAAALVLAAMWAAESVAPMFAARRRVSHGIANLGLAALNAAVAHGFAFAVLFVTEWSCGQRLGLIHRLAGPAWLDWVLAILLFDCWQYWWHRLNHRLPFLWRFHAVHHADAALDATSGVRFHSVEIALSFVVRLLVLPLIGIRVPQLLVYEAMTLPVILFHHSNVRLPYRVDRALRWLIVTPWMHWVHHSRWQPETDSNYSSFLSLWDRLFGSFRLRERPQEIALGLDGWEEREWRGLPGMLLAPFRRRPPVKS
jgi:sterol desaturase/sphingolipid hydroxylase (fatty acid hydroxylase superfamily)